MTIDLGAGNLYSISNKIQAINPRKGEDPDNPLSGAGERRDFPYPLRGPWAGCYAIPFGEYALGYVTPS